MKSKLFKQTRRDDSTTAQGAAERSTRSIQVARLAWSERGGAVRKAKWEYLPASRWL